MSPEARTPCPTPGRCAASSHQVGSAPWRRCKARQHRARLEGRSEHLLAWSTPHPTTEDWQGAPAVRALGPLAALRRGGVLRALGRALDAQVQDRGWSPGSIHPSGGYTARETYRETDRHLGEVLVLDHLDAQNHHHRADGPAVVVYGRAGRLAQATWSVHGRLHRDDGPAVVRALTRSGREPAGGASFFALHGRAVVLDERGEHVAMPRWANEAPHNLRAPTLARHRELLAAGLPQAGSVAWLAAGATLEAAEVVEVAGAGADPGQVLALTQAGADLPTVLDVARGGLPYSWAMAGLA